LDLVRDNWSRVVVEKENPCIVRNSELCIECGHCVEVCPEKKFGFNHRAGDVVVGTPYEAVLKCSFCGKCIEACPTGALMDKNDYVGIARDLNDLKKIAVALVDCDMENKILEKIKNFTAEKDLDKIFSDLGFEKIIWMKKTDANREDETMKKIKTTDARKNKINPKNIVLFFISSQIWKKAEKNEYLDYVLSEREVARLWRDGKKTAGKIKI
jgi:NADH dehydrogenase/NADH:ubiquinone oxidoreductase subunit G